MGDLTKPALVILCLFTLVACGGGGSSSSDNPAPAPPATPSPTTPPPASPTPEPPSSPFGLTVRPAAAPVVLPTRAAAGTPGGYELTNAFPSTSFFAPVFLSGVPGEATLLIVQQSGEIIALVPDTSSQSTLLDLSGRILFAGEQGLLGLALDPNFTSNRYLYVHYSMANPRRSVIARFTWPEGQLVDVTSEKILLEVAQPFSNHNGGMLAFGPDDFLYMAFGDGGAGGDPQNNAQNPSNALGSLLRVDVHPANEIEAYDIPADNPFVGMTGFLPETFAFGLRNPFRFSFDRATGELWLGDVGQGALEEIDIITAGGNYGWRVFEGTNAFDDSMSSLTPEEAIFPVFEYGRAEGVSVIGGYVYRGNQLTDLQGRYIYTDFGSGNVWALTRQTDGSVENVRIANAVNPTSLGEDNDGELYVLSINGTVSQLVTSTPAAASNPNLLSETGLFADIVTLAPNSGLIEYGVNHGFWSDGVIKRRWFRLPAGEVIGFDAVDAWSFPVGTVTVKHFETLQGQNLETRLFIRGADGWEGFTYRWNDSQEDAVLLTGRATTEISNNGNLQTYTFPGPTDCLRCHTDVAGSVLGINTRQLNGDFTYGSVTDNQLRSYDNIALFDQAISAPETLGAFADVSDQSATITQRARTYLEVNCAQCHQPGGPTPVDIDLRFDTPLADTGVLEPPLTDNFGATSNRIITPGDRSTSVLYLRMETLGAERMPPISSHVVDSEGLDVIGQWIDTL